MSEPSGMRWWIPPPAPDETLRSVLERAAALYHWEPGQLWQALNGEGAAGAGTIDAPSSKGLVLLGRALGLPARQLREHLVDDAPWRLDPNARQAVCPICWEQAASGDPQPELRGWTHVLRTWCPRHGAPLCLPVSRNHSGLDHRHVTMLTDEDREILSLIDSFGATLERALFFGEPWPAHWQGCPQSARQRLLQVTFRRSDGTDSPLLANVAPGETLAPFVRCGRHVHAGGENTWEHFRGINDPAIRRAALWVVAWMSIPGLPASLSPGWGIMPPRSDSKGIVEPAGGT